MASESSVPTSSIPIATTSVDPAPFTSRRERRAAEDAQKARPVRPAARRKPAAAPAVAASPAATRPESAPAAARTAASRPARFTAPRRAASKRSMVAQLASFGTIVGVFALLVSTSVPATAFFTADDMAAATSAEKAASAPAAAALSAQDVTINIDAANAAAAAEVVARDSYEAKSFKQQIASLRGNPNFSYTNNPNGTIQWPFPGPVPISSGFGPRAVCSYCSTYHLGLDFTPGSGVNIQSMADGVVSSVQVGNSGLGNNVTVDHVINGQRVQTVYAHMQWGSIQVAVGQQITVGTIIGKVGNTGNSTGAHLHFEVHLDGTPVDPYAWLKANAN